MNLDYAEEPNISTAPVVRVKLTGSGLAGTTDVGVPKKAGGYLRSAPEPNKTDTVIYANFKRTELVEQALLVESTPPPAGLVNKVGGGSETLTTTVYAAKDPKLGTIGLRPFEAAVADLASPTYSNGVKLQFGSKLQ